ncbi:MAG TPA: hypothetical protein VK720_16335, partial [Terracidiphilus sp.]|nr:hypothetical protein [Terracidiphilus sp.]
FRNVVGAMYRKEHTGADETGVGLVPKRIGESAQSELYGGRVALLCRCVNPMSIKISVIVT